MGKNSRRRRETRRRSDPSTRSGDPRRDIAVLLQAATRYASVSERAATPKIVELNELGARASDPHHDPAAVLLDIVQNGLAASYENGWQPAEIVHATRRQTTGAAARWMGHLVQVQAHGTDAMTRAPSAWSDQLQALTSQYPHSGNAEDLLPSGGRASTTQWVAALVVLQLLTRLPPSQALMPPPSAWDQVRVRPTVQVAADQRQARVLTKVRALLAKAESTEFAPEAESFTAKAQDLMARHAIDEALLNDEAGTGIEVDGLHVLIHQPYAQEKVGLLHVIAQANRARAVWNDFASCATLVGVPTDLSQVEMLFTSTLVQATTAMTQTGRDSAGADRSTAFRKAFLTAYSIRIGERLTEATHDAESSYSADLVPVFERQAEAVDAEFERLFPHAVTSSSRRRFHARGWDAGTRAGSAAVLPAAEVAASGE